MIGTDRVMERPTIKQCLFASVIALVWVVSVGWVRADIDPPQPDQMLIDFDGLYNPQQLTVLEGSAAIVNTNGNNVKSGIFMESRFRGNSGSGHGWAGTQTCFYNCIAPSFKVEAPPGGMSWVIGSGKDGEDGTRVTPANLYYHQVEERLGKDALGRLASEEHRKHLGKYLWAKERIKHEENQE